MSVFLCVSTHIYTHVHLYTDILINVYLSQRYIYRLSIIYHRRPEHQLPAEDCGTAHSPPLLQPVCSSSLPPGGDVCHRHSFAALRAAEAGDAAPQRRSGAAAAQRPAAAAASGRPAVRPRGLHAAQLPRLAGPGRLPEPPGLHDGVGAARRLAGGPQIGRAHV